MTEDGFAVGGKPGYGRYSAQPLVTSRRIDALDLAAAVGQRSASFRFELLDGVTDERLGEIHPYIGPATLNHDVGRTIKRDLRLSLSPSDRAAINTLTDRVLPYMIIAGESWPLGRYMFAGQTRLPRSSGTESSEVLMDEMNVVDREIQQGFAPSGACDVAMRQLVAGLLLPMGTNLAASPYPAVGGWRAGSNRGGILNTLSLQGDLETPWMDNSGVMRAVRTVDPATALADLSFDDGYPVLADSIAETDDLLEAPNRFVVIGNGSASGDSEIVGTYDIPPSASHSIASRGFVIQQTRNLQVATALQAMAAARAYGLRSTPVEQVELVTPPDPRHDGYQVIIWGGVQWLETRWSMELDSGGNMTHVLRRAYV